MAANIMEELINIVKNFCLENGIKCRILKSQFEVAQIGQSEGYINAIIYYTNKAAGVKLYIDYDVSRGIDREVLAF